MQAKEPLTGEALGERLGGEAPRRSRNSSVSSVRAMMEVWNSSANKCCRGLASPSLLPVLQLQANKGSARKLNCHAAFGPDLTQGDHERLTPVYNDAR